VVTLAELQANLAARNLEETARMATMPIGLIVLSVTVLAAAVTVALIGSALLVASALKIHQGWAMILTAGVATALAGPAAVLGLGRLRSSFDSFRPSREELRRNLTWLRAVLISRGRIHRRRGV
jgi:Putative Actinobacterial Holin-X, holin superfamily III